MGGWLEIGGGNLGRGKGKDRSGTLTISISAQIFAGLVMIALRATRLSPATLTTSFPASLSVKGVGREPPIWKGRGRIIPSPLPLSSPFHSQSATCAFPRPL